MVESTEVQTAREYKGVLRGNENILYLNYCGGYTHTHIYQTGTIYRINYIQIKLVNDPRLLIQHLAGNQSQGAAAKLGRICCHNSSYFQLINLLQISSGLRWSTLVLGTWILATRTWYNLFTFSDEKIKSHKVPYNAI